MIYLIYLKRKGVNAVIKMMLCCDVNTMKCTPSDIDRELSTFAISYLRVSDSIWLFKYPSGWQGSYLRPEADLFHDHFERYTEDESSIILIELSDRMIYYNLPKSAHTFLTED